MISENIGNGGQSMKDTMKSTSYKILSLVLRMITGFAIGLTMAFIGQEMAQYGAVTLLLVISVVTMVFLRISTSWSVAKILIFDLICVLVGQILKMYILLAP